MRVAREQRRLERLFGAVLLAVSGPATFVACGSNGTSPTPGVDASLDVTDTGMPGIDATADAAADTLPLDDGASDSIYVGPIDGGSCFSITSERDAAADGGPDAQDICDYTLPCGLGASTVAVGCNVAQVALDGSVGDPLPCRILDGLGCTADAYAPGPGGAVTIECVGCFGGAGRRPRGLVRAPPARAATALGAWFAQMAHDEAASVPAFERLASELAALGAPAELVAKAARSARDEVRHASTMRAFAARACARPASPRLRAGGARRSATAVARENAVEGCVRETFSALVAAWQSVHAARADVRAAMRAIARDELRHAALAWAVAGWLEPQLDDATRARLDRARLGAVRKLAREWARSAPASLTRDAGLPRARDAQRMLALLDGTLWGAPGA